MNKCALCFLSVVIVSACCRAAPIPALSKTSDIAVAHSTEPDDNGNQTIRLNDGVTKEERIDESFVIESFRPSIEITAKSVPASLRTANPVDVLKIKESNQVLETRLKSLGINIDGVVAIAKALLPKYPFKQFSKNNLEWMILGKFYFKKAGSPAGYNRMVAKSMFKESKIKILDNMAIKSWRKKIHNFNVETKEMVGKMLWLMRDAKRDHGVELNLDLQDIAKMAFGSEYFERIVQIPLSDRILEVMSEYPVDEGVLTYLKRFDKDPEMKDLSGEKLLRKATHAKLADELQKGPPEPPESSKRKASAFPIIETSLVDGNGDQRVFKYRKRHDTDSK